MRKLFNRQLEKATDASGALDLGALEALVTAAYDDAELDQQRTDRSIELMVGELTAFQAGLKAEIEKRTAQLRQSQKKLRTQNTRFTTALDNMSQGLAMFDRRHRLVICNQQYLEMYDLPRQYGRVGTSLVTILKARIATGTASGGDPATYIEERLATVVNAASSIATHYLNNGRVVSVSHRAMPDGGWVTMHEDITELNSMQIELAHQAFHDSLTGLPNRNLLYRHLAQAFEAMTDGFAVLCLDLDGFKAINDSMGHASGDKLLGEVAARLRDCVGTAGIVGRMGGDEFAVLLPNGSESDALALAEALTAAIRRPFDIDDHAVLVGVSIGIAMAPRDGDGADALLKCADVALYAIKRGRRGGYQLFSHELADTLNGHHRLERDLRRALGQGEFELFYQPVLDLKSNLICGFEALLRWRHPTDGLILPDDFIPLCEELGLVAPIGEWVIDQALAEAARWPAPIRIAVNVSPAQFEHGNLVSRLAKALAASGLAPERVEIEITESLFLEHSPANLATLQQLRELGVRLALDDFGTGYSALSYLLAFPFDKLKVDGAFVAASKDGAAASIILRSVADIARQMGMTIAAEGVETREQMQLVKALGYTEAQGYLVAEPLPREMVRDLLQLAYDAMPEAPFQPEEQTLGLARRS